MKIRPTVTPCVSSIADARETHPAYAMIGASRVSANPGNFLAGSDFRHGHYVIIRISEGEIVRDGALDHAFGDTRRYIEVALSEAQWATFVSTLNMGCGTPCTLQWRDGVAIPEIDRSDDAKRTDRFKDELADRLGLVETALTTLEQQIKKSPLSEVKRKELISTLTTARNNLTPNLGWVAKIFGEHVEETIEKAKIEVTAYMSSVLARAGLKSLGAEAPISMLDGRKDDADG